MNKERRTQNWRKEHQSGHLYYNLVCEGKGMNVGDICETIKNVFK